jgi:hypothetical protein
MEQVVRMSNPNSLFPKSKTKFVHIGYFWLHYPGGLFRNLKNPKKTMQPLK